MVDTIVNKNSRLYPPITLSLVFLETFRCIAKNLVSRNKDTNKIKKQPFNRLLYVIPWGLEPQSKEPESFILSIELRNQMRHKDTKKCISAKKERLKAKDLPLTFSLYD